MSTFNSASASCGALLLALISAVPRFANQAIAGETEPVPIVAVQSCPHIELRAISSYYSDLPSVVIRRDGQPDLLLGKGLAQFSPDCKSFLYMTNDTIVVFDVSSLGSSEGVQGNNAIWMPDSQTIIFSRKHYFELLRLSVATAKVTPLFKPQDATPCGFFSDGHEWNPPILQGPKLLKWTYAIGGPGMASGDESTKTAEIGEPARTVYIDLQTGKVLRSESSRLQCSHYIPSPGQRARKAKE